MINHTRTTLLNVPAAVAPDSVYISPDFLPIQVPKALLRIYDIILSPTTADKPRSDLLNTYMRLLHVADYEPFTLLPDPRITYIPDDRQKFFNQSDTSITTDFARLWNLVRSAVNTLEEQNTSLFRPLENYKQYPNLMSELQDIWNNDLAGIGRLTAAILALSYRFGDLNNDNAS